MKQSTQNTNKGAKLRESWVLCFILGMVMLNYPFLHIFNKTTTFFDIPIMILYFFIGWPASIAVIYFFSRIIDRSVSHMPVPHKDDEA